MMSLALPREQSLFSGNPSLGKLVLLLLGNDSK